MSTGISRLSAADARCQETSGNVRGNDIWITLCVTLGRLLARRAAQRSGLMPASSDGLRAERRRPSTRHGGGRGGTRCRGGRSRQLGAFDRRWCRGRRPGSATTPWLSRGTVVAVALAGRRQPPRRMGLRLLECSRLWRRIGGAAAGDREDVVGFEASAALQALAPRSGAWHSWPSPSRTSSRVWP